MPGVKLRDNYYKVPSVVKSVNAVITSTTPVDIWTPASGKKFRVMGYQLSVWVGVNVAALPIAGDAVLMYDETHTVPIGVIGICLEASPVVGSILHAGIQDAATFAPAATGAGSLIAPRVDIPGGYLSSAANNDVKVVVIDAVASPVTVQDISTCEINVMGTIWGHEE